MSIKINNLQNENETVNRPSKSVVAGSSPAGPTKESAGCGSCATCPLPGNDGRGCLNAGRTLAGIPMDDERWVAVYDVLERLHQSGFTLRVRRELEPGGVTPESAISEIQAIFARGPR